MGTKKTQEAAPALETVEPTGYFVSDGVFRGSLGSPIIEDVSKGENEAPLTGTSEASDTIRVGMTATFDGDSDVPNLTVDKEKAVVEFFDPVNFPPDDEEEDMLQIKFPNGEIYEAPMSLVAFHYANGTVNDEVQIGSEAWMKAFNDAYEAENTLRHWIQNQMCWDDFDRRAELITAKVPNYHDHAGDFLRAELVFLFNE